MEKAIKVVVIYGQNHKGSTYHIAHSLAEKISGEIEEFFLPKDFDEFCVGCATCFMKDGAKCPHYQKLAPITKALDTADVIILASPVYVYHVTGSMKAFLDHYAYRWIIHRPEGSMFTKQGICLTTAAGGGMKSTNKDMADSLFFWGVGRIYKYGIGVAAIDWKSVSDPKKKAIDQATTKLAHKVKKRAGKVSPSLKTKAAFWGLHFLQRKGFNPQDAQYWKEQGWTGKVRPWKSKVGE